MTFIDPALVKSKVLELLFPLICLSLALVMPVGAGVFAADDVGDDEDELVDTGWAWPWLLDSFLSFSFLTFRQSTSWIDQSSDFEKSSTNSRTVINGKNLCVTI